MAFELAEQAFPRVARWVDGYGWIEIGKAEGFRSFVRVLDDGGMIWEGARLYRTLDDALKAADKAIGEWVESELGERWPRPRAPRRARSRRESRDAGKD